MGVDAKVKFANGVLVVVKGLEPRERAIVKQLIRKYISLADENSDDSSVLFFAASEPQQLFTEYARRPLNLPTKIRDIDPFRTNDIDPLYETFGNRTYLDSYVLLDRMEDHTQSILTQAFERACHKVRDPEGDEDEFPIDTYNAAGYFTAEDMENLAEVFRSNYGLISGQWLYTMMY